MLHTLTLFFNLINIVHENILETKNSSIDLGVRVEKVGVLSGTGYRKPTHIDEKQALAF